MPFTQKFRDGADENKHRRADAEIGGLTAHIPLNIGWAKQRHTHQRNAELLNSDFSSLDISV